MRRHSRQPARNPEESLDADDRAAASEMDKKVKASASCLTARSRSMSVRLLTAMDIVFFPCADFESALVALCGACAYRRGAGRSALLAGRCWSLPPTASVVRSKGFTASGLRPARSTSLMLFGSGPDHSHPAGLLRLVSAKADMNFIPCANWVHLSRGDERHDLQRNIFALLGQPRARPRSALLVAQPRGHRWHRTSRRAASTGDDHKPAIRW